MLCTLTKPLKTVPFSESYASILTISKGKKTRGGDGFVPELSTVTNNFFSAIHDKYEYCLMLLLH